ncbi:hypothetical protein HTV80_33625 [Streptomyces sp. Vc74B-19]|uniref:hypothetical protein n=1 Tax=Streptomyces sp. Vc74B-19 TaxID=2741324 RepID=UPI001BFCCC15|nr:hypothetical protein [Streptomyces sp. Vc74B-19]MBT3167992.1 hypothetical protein [Streptomyces sp. Vc74B-19]
MSASFDLHRVFESLAAPKLRAEEAARTRLADSLTNFAYGVDTSLVREAMLKAAIAVPYRAVIENAKNHDIREVIDSMRTRLARQLLTRSTGGSTCQINNEAARMEIEAAQNFLANTEGLLEHAAEAEEAAKETGAREANAPAGGEPAPIEVPKKVTPAQRRALEAIRDNGVMLVELRAGRMQVLVKSGDKPRKDMVEWVIQQGWAKRDTSSSLYEGQVVTLTDLGVAILAA